MMNKWFDFFKGEKGDKGDQGLQGPHGLQGSAGRDVDEIKKIIKLPINLISVSPLKEMDDIFVLLRAEQDLIKFFMPINIQLQVNISGLQTDLFRLTLDNPLLHEHYWTTGKGNLTFYVGIDSKIVGPIGANYLGEFDPIHKIAIIANTDKLVETIKHELGHGLKLDHDESSFMSASIRKKRQNITNHQERLMRINALTFGTY